MSKPNDIEIQLHQRAQAQEILRDVEIFKTGCSVAGPQAKHMTGYADPTLCPECVSGLLTAIRSALGKEPG